MDRKFGAPWNVVIGEYFSFQITYEARGRPSGAALLTPRLRQGRRQRICISFRPVCPAERSALPADSETCLRWCGETSFHADLSALSPSPCQIKNLLYLFLGGTKGILLWKSQ